MSFNSCGVWLGESQRTECRPYKNDLRVYAEFEVAETPKGFVWRYGYSTVETGAVVPMHSSTVKATKGEATTAAVNGLGNAMVEGLDFALAWGSKAEQDRYRKLIEWLISATKPLAQSSLFEAVGTGEAVTGRAG